MKHSIALVTGTTSGVGYEAARLLAANGYRQVIVTGRSLARVQETVAQLAAQTRTQVFTPLELELDEPTSVQSALAELVKRDQPIDFLLLNAGLVPGKKRMITTAGVEASQAPLIGHHQLTVGLLRANLLSPNARIAIASAEPARGGAPMFKYTDVDALAARYHQGDRTAAMEALLRNGPSVKYVPNNAYADAKLIVAWWVAALARRLPRHGRVRSLARCGDRHQCGAKRRLGSEISNDPNREPHSRHESDAGDRGPSVPSGVGVRNRRLRTILRLGQREVHRPN
ncbi:SDR family NAD(P)-dependent oxidoreductase [Paraburkholderia strydomiana]